MSDLKSRERADLTGRTLGRFRLVRRLGEGATAVVYMAAIEVGAGSQDCALKVLDPPFAARPGFRERFRHDVEHVSRLGHPHIVPVYDYGLNADFNYVGMGIALGGTLADRLRRGPVEPRAVWKILGPVAQALDAMHGVGVLHLDIKPTNILFDPHGTAVLSDFGLARTHLGFAIGTPGYMAPEQAMGGDLDHRADIYALAIVAFEMLTGTRFHADLPTPDLLYTTVEREVPSARQRQGNLSSGIDTALRRALARRRDHRPRTAMEFMWDLARVLNQDPATAVSPPSPPASAEITSEAFKGTFTVDVPAADDSRADAEAEFDQARTQLMTLFNTTLSAGIVADESSFIVGWNGPAEATFGWRAEEITGRSLSSTLIPIRYREAHERGFKRFMESGEGPVLGKVIEITSMHRDGREFPIELSISPAARLGHRALFVAFARDITEQKGTEQLKVAQRTLDEVLRATPGLEAAATRILEAIGVSLGWSVGILWTFDGPVLRCATVWKSETAECGDFERAARSATQEKGLGLAGRAWAHADVVWIEDVLRETDLPLALPALRGGLHSAIGIPILKGNEVRAVLEFYSGQAQRADDNLLVRMFQLGRRIGSKVG